MFIIYWNWNINLLSLISMNLLRNVLDIIIHVLKMKKIMINFKNMNHYIIYYLIMNNYLTFGWNIIKEMAYILKINGRINWKWNTFIYYHFSKFWLILFSIFKFLPSISLLLHHVFFYYLLITFHHFLTDNLYFLQTPEPLY